MADVNSNYTLVYKYWWWSFSNRGLLESFA